MARDTDPNGAHRDTRPEGDAPETPREPRRLRRQVAFARAALFWEALLPRVMTAGGLLLLFGGLALLGVFQALPGWLHAALLILFAAGIAGALWRDLRGLHVPDGHAGRRRLERASGLRHRPLTTLDDTLVTGARDRAAAELWEAHRARLRGMLHRLRVGWPHPGLAARDPRALRAVPLLLLAAGLIASGPRVPDRLAAALRPDVGASAAAPPEVTVWLDPPGYTGEAPRVLDTPGAGAEKDAKDSGSANGASATASPQTVRVPEGSRILAQVQGGDGTPALHIGNSKSTLAPVASGAWKGDITLGRGGIEVPGASDLIVRQDNEELARWPLHLLIDQAPIVAFQHAPRAGRRYALRVAHRVSDDYGVTDLRLRITRPADERIEPIERRLPMTRPPAGADAETAGAGVVEGVSYHDLTSHIWAGLEVQATLVAKDARGQTGTSKTLTLTLPERDFTHPVAKELVALRRQLAREPDDRGPVVQSLQALQRRPGAFGNDFVVALALRTSERRLAYDTSFAGLREVQEVMWRTALRLEDGDLAIAERDLRRAQDALREALADPETTAAELDRLMNELEQAMARFFEAMEQRLRQQLSEGMQPQQAPEGAQTLETRDLQEMVQRMRDMARSGSRDAAQQMLSELRNMLENMRMMPRMGQMSPDGMRAQQMMRDLQSLSQRQQDLLDQTFQRAQEGMRQGGMQAPQQGGQQGQPQAGPQSGQEAGQAARMQDDIRRGLGDLMREFGDMMGQIPGALGKAEQQMRSSSKSLGQGDPRGAVEPQTNALDNLRQGMQRMQEAFQQRMQAQQRGRGQGQGRYGFQPSSPRDPLGRRQGEQGRAGADQSDVNIPSEQQLQRAREILNELRRRAGERERPTLEQDYIRRLLERF